MNKEEYLEHLKNAPENVKHIAKLWESFVKCNDNLSAIYKRRMEVIDNLEQKVITPIDALNLYEMLVAQLFREFRNIGKAIGEYKEVETVRAKNELDEIEQIRNKLNEFLKTVEEVKDVVEKIKAEGYIS